jgi:phospholipase C
MSFDRGPRVSPLVARVCAVAATLALAALPAASPASQLHVPGTLAFPRAASPITHVVILVMENRTFDNLFHGFPGADTVDYGLTHTGQSVKLHSNALEAAGDPSHSHTSLVTEYDNGKMDGFDLDKVGLIGAFPPTFPYAYVPLSEIGADYWALAKHYGVADRMFASQNAPSYPAHQYLIAGQAGRAIEDPTSLLIWGCDAQSGTTVALLAPDGKTEQLPGPFPCFDYPTMGDLLDQGGVSWKYYTGSIGTPDGGVSGYDAIHHIRYGSDWSRNVASPEQSFLSDALLGILPQVSWVTPPILSSDHAGTFTSGGPKWVGAVYEAIANSSYYGHTAFFVTWDDSGGWYDHVPPPVYNGFGYGFRVPLIAISPYAKPHYVSHVVHDFGSILHFVEKNFGLGSLGQDDAQADDLSDMFDYSQRAVKPISVPFSPFDSVRRFRATRPLDDDR